jgi:hypothetical protein
MTRPTIKAFMFGAAPQMALPTSKRRMQVMKSDLMSKTPKALPLQQSFVVSISLQKLAKKGRCLHVQRQDCHVSEHEADSNPCQVLLSSECRDDGGLEIGDLEAQLSEELQSRAVAQLLRTIVPSSANRKTVERMAP